MSVKDCIDYLGLEAKVEGSQLVVDCHLCGKAKHCYIDGTTGLYHCKVCNGTGNPYQLIKHYTPSMSPSDILKLLEQFGLNNGVTEKQPEKSKDLSWLRDKLRKPTDDEVARLCKAKGLSVDALLKFNPYCHKTEPIMFLPGFKPGDSKACGFLRVHLDGELIKLTSGKEEKYPLIGSHGLLGLSWVQKQQSEKLIFTESWGNMAMAIEAGHVTIASSGGASCFKDEWLPVFKGKVVYLVFDRDHAGQMAQKTAAEKIYQVAKEVRIAELPYEIQKSHGKDLKDYLQGK